jgi:hypothetical protein
MKKRILITVCAVLVVALLLGLLQALVTPKYTSNPEGLLTGEYYAEAGEHDVLFIGDCEVYESFIPAYLWEKHGISSYVRGSAQQLTWQSYYLLEDTLRYEKPKAVVFNVLALKYGEPQNEAYNRMTLDSMKWSRTKIDAIKASMTEDESFVDYVFPILRYHSRITELEGDDFKYIFKDKKVSHSGYLMQKGVVPMESGDMGEGRDLLDYTLPTTSVDYLEKMRVLCAENGIELILIKSPTNSWGYWWYDEWDEQVREYAEQKGLAYYNLIPKADEIGIDYSTDTYDRGIHLNVYGAEKVTDYFGKILKDNHGLGGLTHSEAHVIAWKERVDAYYKERNS